jgi:hypothetical protein
MRIDLYTKVILTITAGLLGLHLVHEFRIESVKAAGVSFSTQTRVIINPGQPGFVMFDPTTGDLWHWNTERWDLHLQFTKLGDPVQGFDPTSGKRLF